MESYVVVKGLGCVDPNLMKLVWKNVPYIVEVEKDVWKLAGYSNITLEETGFKADTCFPVECANVVRKMIGIEKLEISGFPEYIKMQPYYDVTRQTDANGIEYVDSIEIKGLAIVKK